ncbi:MAG: hypothetical protein Ct9H300mP29_9010 [Candidatus Neomarinimicrobiota bacterium]|nr:MAG: hypothetical protein Ct9H300mP29_9010 [Candidatus Neomarinimicrobiota bacterium]
MDFGEGNGVLDEGERLNLEDIKYFNQSQWAVHLSHPGNYKQFTIGFGAQRSFHNLGGYNGTGFGLDIGAKVSPLGKWYYRFINNNCPTSWLLWENGTVERKISRC